MNVVIPNHDTCPPPTVGIREMARMPHQIVSNPPGGDPGEPCPGDRSRRPWRAPRTCAVMVSRSDDPRFDRDGGSNERERDEWGGRGDLWDR
jgi:hypothetical protein